MGPDRGPGGGRRTSLASSSGESGAEAPPLGCPAALTLQVVELARAVLPCDVLPVGAARQGHHGAQGGGPLAHLHLELWQREERAVSAPPGQKQADGCMALQSRGLCNHGGTFKSPSLRTRLTAQRHMGFLAAAHQRKADLHELKRKPLHVVSLKNSERQPAVSRGMPCQLFI